MRVECFFVFILLLIVNFTGATERDSSNNQTVTMTATPPAPASANNAQLAQDTAGATALKARIPVSESVKIPVLDFRNTDIRDILQGIGMQYSLNIYVEPEVHGTMTIYLTNIAVRDAIDFIVKRRGFGYTVENGIVKVFKPAEPVPLPPPKPQVVFSLKDSLLSVDFRELSAIDVSRLFIDSARVNVIIEGQSAKTLTGRFTDLPLEKAVKVIFEPQGFTVRKTDNMYMVSAQSWAGDEGKAAGAAGPRRVGAAVTKNRRVSFDVTNASLDDLIRSVAMESGINVVMYDKINGTISAKLDSVTLDDMFRFVLQNTTYTFWKEGNIYFFGSREMSQYKTSVVIPLHHIRAKEDQIGKVIPPKIAQDAVIKYDSEHNSVIVIGSIDVIAKAQEFFGKIDIPIPQVLIEALVVEFNLSKIRSYGVSVYTGGPGDTVGLFNENILPTLHLKPGRLRTTALLNEVLSYLGAKRVVELPKSFRMSIQALETADIVKVHSTPQIATINGNTASIVIGETRYFKLIKEIKSTEKDQTTAGVIGFDERFEEKKFNTELEITPYVMADGYVMVEIKPEFNIPRSGGTTDRPPTVDTRTIKSMVRLRDGQTIVLGGQRQTEDLVNSRGIPVLGSIPLLGWLFSSKTLQKSETQMMIFLTPHVYYGDENTVTPDTYFGNEIEKMLDKYDPERKKAKDKKPSPKRTWRDIGTAPQQVVDSAKTAPKPVSVGNKPALQTKETKGRKRWGGL